MKYQNGETFEKIKQDIYVQKYNNMDMKLDTVAFVACVKISSVEYAQKVFRTTVTEYRL